MPTPNNSRPLEDVMSAGLNGVECPLCGCHDMRADKTIQLQTRILRYRKCRHCGHKVLTRQPREEVIRDVNGR